MPLPITENEKKRLMHQIFALFAQYGIDGISMDEVAKQIRLSKATIYKYFKSKEEIVREIVNERIEHLKSVQLTSENNIEGVLRSLSSMYSEGLITGAYSSSKFIIDLGNKFPDILSDYVAELEIEMNRFIYFYEEAIQEGYCKQVSIELVGANARMILPSLTKPEILIGLNITLPFAIKEYYKLFLCQLLSVEYMKVIDEESTYLFVDDLIKFLESRFLTD